MGEESILRKTLLWTGALVGISAVWVGLLSLVSVLVVSHALPESTPATTSPATPSPKPASSEPPSRSAPSHAEDSPLKRRAG